MTQQPNYFNQFDMAALTEEFPIGPEFLRRFEAISRDELRALQNGRFTKMLAQAWKIPFYQRLWGAKGIEAGDIKSLDDITKLPTFDKSDIMDSIAANPPFGDFHGMETYPDGERPPVIVHTTSGTTGRPQVLMYGPRSREIQNLLVARTYYRACAPTTWCIPFMATAWSTAAIIFARRWCIGQIRFSYPPVRGWKPGRYNRSIR
jgi:phenylacetate-CoA ligase